MTADKGVQVCYGDDTALLEAMERVRSRRSKGSSNAKGGRDVGTPSSSQDDDGQEEDILLGTQATSFFGGAAGADAVEVDGESHAGQGQLLSFLQRASGACERLLEEAAAGRKAWKGQSAASQRDKEREQEKARGSVYAPDEPWVLLGKDTASGANELIRSRRSKIDSFLFSLYI